MNDGKPNYRLSQAPNEVERLSAWADTWEPAAEELFKHIPVEAGWNCLDLGCGPHGVLGPLGRRVGPNGSVTGIDLSQANVAAARDYASHASLTNVEVIQADVLRTNLPRASFDLVHVRFMFAPLGHERELLQEMLDLARPGGVVVAQESCEAGYECFPPQAAWQRLKEVTIAAFAQAGGDYNAGRRTYGLMRQVGCLEVNGRAVVLALPAGHPFRRWPIESAMALRQRILDAGLMTEGEFEATLEACQHIAEDPEIWMTSFMVTQVWGHKPARG
jgi:ubiquinone/menaquinone biosynthesis C-methylase UbiE